MLDQDVTAKESVRTEVQLLYQRRVFPVVYGARTLVGLGQRGQLALILSCQTQCQWWHGCKGLADAKSWPRKWFMAKLASRAGALKLE